MHISKAIFRLVYFSLLTIVSLGQVLAQSINTNEAHSNSDRNRSFHELSKLTVRPSEISFPFIGEFHFKDYHFVDSEDGLLKYNYHLATAEIFPSYYLLDRDNSRSNIRITFGAKLRIWNKRYAPLRTNYEWHPSHSIKTPSFLPGVFYTRLLKFHSNGDLSKYKTIEIGIEHHSNGQDGPTLVSQDSTLVLPPGQKYNIVDGDFSANKLSIKYNFISYTILQKSRIQSIHLELDDIDNGKFQLDDLHKYKLSYTFQLIKFVTDEGFDKNVLANSQLDFHFKIGTHSFSDFELKKAITYSVSYHHRLPMSQQIFAFAKYGYMGQDDYNIYLEQNLHYFKFGISFWAFTGMTN